MKAILTKYCGVTDHRIIALDNKGNSLSVTLPRNEVDSRRNHETAVNRLCRAMCWDYTSIVGGEIKDVGGEIKDGMAWVIDLAITPPQTKAEGPPRNEQTSNVTKYP